MAAFSGESRVRRAQFVFTGSSARKLKRGRDLNRLPGRVVVLRLDPLTIGELLPGTLDEALLDGALPGVRTTAEAADREADLRSYVETYLEEEVRQEALVRNIGAYGRFVELAAREALRAASRETRKGDTPHSRREAREMESVLSSTGTSPSSEWRRRRDLTAWGFIRLLGGVIARRRAERARRREDKGNVVAEGLEVPHLRAPRTGTPHRAFADNPRPRCPRRQTARRAWLLVTSAPSRASSGSR